MIAWNDSCSNHHCGPVCRVSSTDGTFCVRVKVNAAEPPKPPESPDPEEDARARIAKARLAQEHKEKCRQAFRRPPKRQGRGADPGVKWSRKRPARRQARRHARRRERRR